MLCPFCEVGARVAVAREHPLRWYDPDQVRAVEGSYLPLSREAPVSGPQYTRSIDQSMLYHNTDRIGGIMKRLGMILAPVMMAAALGSCAIAPDTGITGAPDTQSGAAQTPSVTTEGSLSTIFASLPEEFYLSSGAGGWHTEVYIGDDGTFSGEYTGEYSGDSDTGGLKGASDRSQFTGKFEVTSKVSDFEYNLNLLNLTELGTPGEETVEDGVLYHTVSGVYGLDDGTNFVLYLPGRPTDDLPPEFLQWSHGPQDWEQTPGGTLPFWGLYNVDAQEGFIGMDDD